MLTDLYYHTDRGFLEIQIQRTTHLSVSGFFVICGGVRSEYLELRKRLSISSRMCWREERLNVAP